MQNRTQIIKDFFQLRVFLNRSNQLPNQPSQLKFEIRSGGARKLELVATMVCHGRRNSLILAQKLPQYTWQSSGFSTFVHLEDFCSESLNRYPEDTKVEVLETKLWEELRNLGVE
jgi:hypothetical protein